MTTPEDLMRRRLRALADAEPLARLDEAARARAERRARQALQASEPSWLPRLSLAAAGVLLAFLGAQAWGELDSHVGQNDALETVQRSAAPRVEARPRARERRAEAARTAPPGESALAVGADMEARCAELSAASWVTLADGQQALELGQRALLVAADSSQTSHQLSARCDIQVALAVGRLAVHARRLEGRQLSVRTPLAEVVVKGTVFEVDQARDGRELRVSVDEGLVQVTLQSGELHEVEPGFTLIVTGGASLSAHSERKSYPRWQRQLLRQQLGITRAEHRAQDPTPTTSTTSTTPVADEARYWHPGSVSAPQVPPTPGSSVTSEGRPMSKPHVSRE